MGLNAPTAGSDRYDTFTEWHTVVHPHEAQNAVLSMIVHGVFERFPRLRVAYMEAGCGWLPVAGCTASTSTSSSPARSRRPSSRCRPPSTSGATAGSRTECDDRFVADVIRWMGDDHIVYETDFPHPDSKYPKATEHFLGARARPHPTTQQAEDPVGQRGRPVPVPRGLPAGVVSDFRRPCEAVDYDECMRAFPPPPEYFETAWSRAPEVIERVQLERLQDRALTASRVPFFARPVGGGRASTRARSPRWTTSGGRRPTPSTTSAGASTTIRRGATTRASRPTMARSRADAGVHVGRHDREVAGRPSTPRGTARSARLLAARAALHAGDPPRRRRAQLVGLRAPQRRVLLRRGPAPLAQLRRAHHRARATSPAASARSSWPSSTGAPRS